MPDTFVPGHLWTNPLVRMLYAQVAILRKDIVEMKEMEANAEKESKEKQPAEKELAKADTD